MQRCRKPLARPHLSAWRALYGERTGFRVGSSGGSVKVRARGLEGRVEATALSDRSLLEIYVIDVGQGDGLKLKTPNRKLADPNWGRRTVCCSS
jgi:hypothetical protein